MTDTLLCDGQRTILTAKNTAISNKLIPLMPFSTHKFWNDTTTDDGSADLVESFE